MVCLDNFATENLHNLYTFINRADFKLIKGDIRDLNTSHNACVDVDYVLHQIALGSIPRSI